MAQSVKSSTETVLVIEDDADLAKAIVACLLAYKFKAIVSSTAADATTKLSKQAFFCVLLDLKLERGTGEQVVQYMRGPTSRFNRDTPVILTSGQVSADVLMRLKPHLSGVLVKPFELDQLIEKLESLR
jgi:DNA-binding response OmpR family regulator